MDVQIQTEYVLIRPFIKQKEKKEIKTKEKETIKPEDKGIIKVKEKKEIKFEDKEVKTRRNQRN